MARVLVAEDDPKQAELARLYLANDGYTAIVVNDGRAVLTEIRRGLPDLLVLDLMMPEIDGWDVCRILHSEHPELPILMLTARSTVDDRLHGLDLGADDYLTKPYDPRELMARVRALLRRAHRADRSEHDRTTLAVGSLRVDVRRHEVSIDGLPVDCTAGEFTILHTLMSRPGQVFSRAQLLEVTRGDTQYVTPRTIDVHVSNLRRKIEPDPRVPVFLVTVFGVGYKLGRGDRPPA
jgi:DNA-binding response OmpR family regulator